MEQSRIFEADIAIPGTEQRAYSRRLVNFAASVRDAGITSSKVRVSDLSPGGCKVAGVVDLEIGTEIWLKITGIAAVRAEVVRSDESGIGCKFPVPMARETIEQLTAEARPVRSGIFGRAPGSPT